VVRDFDGHTVELLTPQNRDAKIVENYNKAYRSGDAQDAK
jgi:hypothetical protein